MRRACGASARLVAVVACASVHGAVAASASASSLAAGPVPLPVIPLRALVIDVQGTAQWRASEDDAWRDAEVDHVLRPGAEVRTALRSSVALRVGRNATALVDSCTRLVLPVIILDGKALRTRAAVPRGRVDFKIDEVGLTNDFEVMTPTSTLAVRGTGFAVTWGGLGGLRVDVLSAEVAAVEVRYLRRQLRYLVKAGSASREGHPDPAVAALFQTFAPPPASLSEEEAVSGLTGDAFLDGNLSRGLLSVENAIGGSQRISELVGELSPEVQAICANLDEFFGAYADALSEGPGFQSFGQLAAFAALVDDVEAFCESLDSFQGDPLAAILEEVSAFCQTFDEPFDAQQCEALFDDLLPDPTHGP